MRIQTQFLIINVIGGIAVLGGYVIALINHPKIRGELWGGVQKIYDFGLLCLCSFLPLVIVLQCII